ncbi:MAG: four helix bundle protein [Phycisphaerae bacterium]|nr:four helix bundle protein [Phycisphaerae bacterium]
MAQGKIRSFEDLECWQACRQLRLFVTREVLPLLPRDEKYRLGDQLIRAARSTTANIAEGYGRFHYLDNAKFCSNSRGSCWEVLDHLIAGNDDGFVSADALEKGRSLANHAVKLLNGYMGYLQRAGRQDSVHEPNSDYSLSREVGIGAVTRIDPQQLITDNQ